MFRNLSYNSVARLLSTVFNFLIVVFLAKYLGAKVKGEATLLHTNISFILLFSSVVGGGALIHLQAKKELFKFIVPSFLWSALVSVLFYFTANTFNLFPHSIVLHTSILSIFFAFNFLISNILLAKNSFRNYNFTLIAPVVITLFSTSILFFVFNNQSLITYILALYLAYSVSILVGLYWIKRDLKMIDFKGGLDALQHSFLYGFGFQLAELLMLLSFRLYFYILNYYQSTSDLGLFSTGVSILEVSWIFSRSFFWINYATFSKNINQTNLNYKIFKFVKVGVLITIFYIAFLYLIPSDIYAFVFGKSFKNVMGTVKWLVPGIIVFNVFYGIQSYFVVIGKYKEIIFSLFIGLIAQIIICNLLIENYYYSGASFAASSSFIIATVILLYFFKRHTKHRLIDFIVKW